MSMSTAWAAITVTLAIFVVSHIISSVWWASRMNTLINILQRDLKDIIAEIRYFRGSLASKEEVARNQAIMDKELNTMWKKIDNLQNKGV